MALLQDFDIEADWNLDLFCNFNCTYCVSRSNERVMHYTPAELQAIDRFFTQTALRWHIHLTGGEPFLVRNFIALCSLLAKRHILSINSNLSTSNVETFAKSFPKNAILFINAGVHIIERESRGSVTEFIHRIHVLERSGFDVYASYVMSPDLFNRFEADFHFFAERGIVIFPKILRSTYMGKSYPEAYTLEERVLFQKFYDLAFNHSTQRTAASHWKHRLIDLRYDREFVHGIPRFQGRMCSAGREFVRIFWDGRITRCDQNTIIGNVLANEFKRYESPELCNTYSCPYFCAKYSTKVTS